MARGRARRMGARYPSGKVRPQEDADIRAVVIAQPHRRHFPVEYNDRGRIVTDRRLDQLASEPLGRLKLAGLISAAEYAAGDRYGEVTRRYYAVRGVPDDTRQPVAGSGTGLEDDEAIKRLRAWNEAEARLKFNPEARRVAVKVCVGLRDPEGIEHSYLLAALRALARHWGLTQEAKSVHPVG